MSGRKRKPLKQDAFLTAYAQTGMVTRAAQIAGISPGRHYEWLNDDEGYEERFHIAREQACAILRDEARRRAVEGIERLKLYHGKPVRIPLRDEDDNLVLDCEGKPQMVPYVEHRYSDRLLILLLKAMMPHVFGNSPMDPDDGRVETQTGVLTVVAPTTTESEANS